MRKVQILKPAAQSTPIRNHELRRAWGRVFLAWPVKNGTTGFIPAAVVLNILETTREREILQYLPQASAQGNKRPFAMAKLLQGRDPRFATYHPHWFGFRVERLEKLEGETRYEYRLPFWIRVGSRRAA